MSVYGPKIEMPHVEIPQANIDPKIIGLIIGALAIIIIAIFFIPPILESMNPSIKLAWTNNPLDLKDNPATPASLNITLINNTKETTDITLSVTSESEEIIIFCPDNTIPKVEPNGVRKTDCLIRRNPDSRIFAGTYSIKVKTNLGEAITTLEVKTK